MLAIVRNSEFYGTVGLKTNVKCDGETVHLGDVVETEINGTSFTGLVVIARRRASVFGASGVPIESLNIKRIVRSHKELQDGHSIDIELLFEIVKIQGLEE